MIHCSVTRYIKFNRKSNVSAQFKDDTQLKVYFFLFKMYDILPLLLILFFVRIFLQLLRIANDSSDESLIASIENLSKTFAIISCQAVSLTENEMTSWVQRFNLAASSLVTCFLREAIHVCSLRDAEEEFEDSDNNVPSGAYWNDELVVGSSFVTESVKEMASIGRCAASDIANVLSECLQQRSECLREV